MILPEEHKRTSYYKIKIAQGDELISVTFYQTKAFGPNILLVMIPKCDDPQDCLNHIKSMVAEQGKILLTMRGRLMYKLVEFTPCWN